MYIHLHGTWLMLIGNVQINFGVSRHFMLTFSYLADDRKCCNLVNTDYIVSSCWRL